MGSKGTVGTDEVRGLKKAKVMKSLEDYDQEFVFYPKYSNILRRNFIHIVCIKAETKSW